MAAVKTFASLFEATAELIGAKKFAELATEQFKKQAVIRHLLIPDPCSEPNEYASPAALLRPEYQIVKFQYRDAVFENLLNWCDLNHGDLGWRLIHGDTGRGKTRLMVELCAELNKETADMDWVAGFLNIDAVSGNPDAYEVLFDCPKPILIIVDYAERQEEIVTELMKRSLYRSTGKNARATKIAFISRRRTDIWDRIFSRDSDLHSIDRGLLEDFGLSPVTESTDVAEVYEAAFSDFRDHLEKTHPAPALDFSALGGQRGQPDFGLVHMLALMAALAPEELTNGADARPTRDQVVAFLLEREARHWRKTAESLGLAAELQGERILSSAAVLFTLASQQGAVPDAGAARNVLRNSPLLADQSEAHLDQAALVFQEIYPGAGHVNAPVPDLLADYLIVDRLENAEPDLPRMFGADAAVGFSDAQSLSALTRLNWIAQRWPEFGEKQIRSALHANPSRVMSLVIQVAVESGDPIGRITAEWFNWHGDPGLAMDLEPSFPEYTTALRELAAVVSESALAVADDVSRAGLLNNLAIRLSALGRREEALERAEEAVDVYRRLAHALPDAFTPYLAGSLNNLATMLRRLAGGRRRWSGSRRLSTSTVN